MAGLTIQRLILKRFGGLHLAARPWCTAARELDHLTVYRAEDWS